MRRWCIGFLVAASFSNLPALASDPEWLDGQFDGNAIDLFAGQLPAIKDFIKSHPGLAQSASTNLSQCPDDDTKELCHLNQTRFILDYIAAFYGDHDSQQNIAYSLSGDGMPPKLVGMGNAQVGVNPSPSWGCAWRIAILTSGNSEAEITDLDNYKVDCEALPSDQQTQAESIAVGFLVPHIHSTMASGKIQYALVDDYPGSP